MRFLTSTIASSNRATVECKDILQKLIILVTIPSNRATVECKDHSYNHNPWHGLSF